MLWYCLSVAAFNFKVSKVDLLLIVLRLKFTLHVAPQIVMTVAVQCVDFYSPYGAQLFTEIYGYSPLTDNLQHGCRLIQICTMCFSSPKFKCMRTFPSINNIYS